MPNYNQSLQSNNTNLQAILSLAKQLPLASSQVDHSNEDAIISRTISGSYTNSRITNLKAYAFNRCINLSEVHLPSITTIGSLAFVHCVNLSSVVMSAVKTISVGAFGTCSSLTTVDFPMVTQIEASAFRGCVALSSLYLGASTVCTLTNSDAFSDTPFAGLSDYFSGTPCIYVPSSLITTYQSATNWVYYSSYFRTIEKPLITFKYENIEYQAEEGMTWGEWVDSEYNTDGFYISDEGDVVDDSGVGVVTDRQNPTEFTANDIIITNGSYFRSDWV